MISLQELLKNNKLEDLSPEIQANLFILLDRVNKIRLAWGRPCVITSCIRTPQEQIEVYRKKGITDKSKIPMKSKHLLGAALDISDPDLALTKWLEANPQVIEDCDIWLEKGNSNWVHIQIQPFGSYKAGGTRWFLP